MNDLPPSHLLDRIVIRVPDGMRERIAASAKESNRSVNAELVSLLEMYYPKEPSTEELIEQIELCLSWAKHAERPYKYDLWNSLEAMIDRLRGEAQQTKDVTE